MELGTGILVATILAIAAWQIDKRGAWKKTGKTVLWITAAVVVVTGAILGYAAAEDWWRGRDQAQELATEREQLREQLRGTGIATYLELRLGMSPNEVLYVLGEPASRQPESDDDLAYWTYDLPSRAIVWERGGNKVRGMFCRESTACPPLVGVQIEDDEAELRSKLGPPLDPDVLPGDDGYLTLDYGPRSGTVRFRLYQKQVQRMGLLRLPSPEELAREKAAREANEKERIEAKKRAKADADAAVDAAERQRRATELRAREQKKGTSVVGTPSTARVVEQIGPMPPQQPAWHDRNSWTRVRDGMSAEQVIGILGRPTSTETVSSFTTLYYRGLAGYSDLSAGIFSYSMTASGRSIHRSSDEPDSPSHPNYALQKAKCRHPWQESDA